MGKFGLVWDCLVCGIVGLLFVHIMSFVYCANNGDVKYRLNC